MGSGETLSPGDEIAFSVTLSQPGFMTVVGLDSRVHASTSDRDRVLSLGDARELLDEVVRRSDDAAQ